MKTQSVNMNYGKLGEKTWFYFGHQAWNTQFETSEKSSIKIWKNRNQKQKHKSDVFFYRKWRIISGRPDKKIGIDILAWKPALK